MNLWSMARFDLRLTDEEFYQLTPRQFDALCKRHQRQTEANEILFGQLTSWVANTGFRSTEGPTQTMDFMPSQWGKRTRQNPVNDLSGDDVLDRLRQMFPRV